MTRLDPTYTHIAFVGDRCLARGSLAEVALAVRRSVDVADGPPAVVLDALDSQVVDLDLRGSDEAILARLPRPAASGGAVATQASADVDAPPRAVGPGRPRLGVVSREVSLLPRHWEWLATQRGGASATLRRLVDDARRRSAPEDRLRAAREAVDRFMRVMAGDRPNYEEASRAFYAGRDADLARLVADWPADIRSHLDALVRRCRNAAP
jgi:hypothetical protein